MQPDKILPHAQKRMRQRGFDRADIELALQIGTIINDDCIFVRRSDVQEEIARMKHQIKRLERLAGTKVVAPSDVVVTIYRPSHRRLKRDLRRSP